MAALFTASKQNASLHLKSIYHNGELDAAATVKESLSVQTEGGRELRNSVTLYNLDAILAYEYLIGQFAVGSGKKAGEFYTPQRISDTLSAIVPLDRQDQHRGLHRPPGDPPLRDARRARRDRPALERDGHLGRANGATGRCQRCAIHAIDGNHRRQSLPRMRQRHADPQGRLRVLHRLRVCGPMWLSASGHRVEPPL